MMSYPRIAKLILAIALTSFVIAMLSHLYRFFIGSNSFVTALEYSAIIVGIVTVFVGNLIHWTQKE